MDKNILHILQKRFKLFPDIIAVYIFGSYAGTANRLIHEYNKVTPEELYELMQTRLTDLTLFCKYVVDFLQQ